MKIDSTIAKKKKQASAKHSKPIKSDSAGKNIMSVEQKVIAVMAELRVLNIKEPQRIQVALHSGYSNVRSASFSKAMKTLKLEGFIVFPNKDTVKLTDEGVKASGGFAQPPTGNEEVHERIKKLLDPKACKLFEVLADGGTHVKKDVASVLNYTNERSAGFANSLTKMIGLGILEYVKDATNPKTKSIRLTDVAFPFGRDSTNPYDIMTGEVTV